MSVRCSADAVLDRGTPGLRYLAEVAPDETGELVDRYWRHRRIDLAGMRSDADTLYAAAAIMRAHLLAQEQAVARLASGWAGRAADAAVAALDRRLDRARADCAVVADAADALGGAADLIGEALSEQARVVERLGAPAAGPGSGLDPVRAREALVPHVRSCLAALTRLLDTVDLVVAGARRAVAQVIEAPGVADGHAAPPESAPPESARPEPAPPESAPPAPAVEAVSRDEAVAPDDSVPTPESGPTPDPSPAPDTASGALGVGPGSVPRDDRPRAEPAPPVAPPDESDTGAELADAGPL